VQRPEEVAPAIRCSPESTYGISFQAIDNNGDFEWPVVTQDPKAGWPPGAYVGGRGIGGVLVMVTAPSQAEGLEVLATMRAIGPEGDLNGCSARRDRAPTVDVPDGAMAVCRYDADGQLEQSELLTGPDAKAAGAALDAAPQGQLDCQPSAAPPELIVMRDRERAATIELDGACTAIGGLAEGRIITPDVLYWALSPGWSGDATGLPLPPELRTR
jgi:hypothetical protein